MYNKTARLKQMFMLTKFSNQMFDWTKVLLCVNDSVNMTQIFILYNVFIYP